MPAKEYIVLDVKEWPNSQSEYGSKMSVTFKGEGEPVDMQAKKFPVPGETEYGEITDYYTKSGNARRKFKRLKRPEDVQARIDTAMNKPTKKEDGMAWGNSLNVAVLALAHNVKKEDLLEYAQYLFEHRITNVAEEKPDEVSEDPKERTLTTTGPGASTGYQTAGGSTGYEKAKEAADAINMRRALDDGVPIEAYSEADAPDPKFADIDTTKPIDLSDIPF